MIRHFQLASTALLCLALVWAPLPFASVTRPAEAALQVLSFLALAAAVVEMHRLEYLARCWKPAAVLAALAALGVVQALPLPAGWARALTDLPGDAAARTLSVNPGASLAAALGWSALAAAFTAAAVAGRRSGQRRALGCALVAAALFEVFYGARRWLLGSTEIWGVTVPNTTARLRGTFVNADHFALYLEIALAVVFGWSWWALRRARKVPYAEARLALAAPPLVVWLVLFTALAFTGSRAGLAAALAALLVQAALLAAASRKPWGVLLAGGAAAAGVATVALLGLRQGFGRLLGTSSYEVVALDSRIDAAAATADLWALSPWLGCGLGTFQHAFPVVQPAGLGGFWTHAHNEPLELLATTGLVGAGLALAGLVALSLRLVRVARDGIRSEDRAAGLAGAGALAAVVLHGFFDFGLSMPANAFTLALVCSAAAAAPRRPREGREESAPGPA